MKTHLCFVRHGETDWNIEGRIQGTIDNPLNEIGIIQAKRLGTYLKNNEPRWDVIISSPLSRAMATACIIQIEIGDIPLHIEEGFMERQFGDAEGVIITKQLFEDIVDEKINGLESSTAIQDRVYNATIKISKKFEGKNILIVAHSHVIKALLSKLDTSYSFKTTIKNLSLNTFILDNDTLQIEAINQIYI